MSVVRPFAFDRSGRVQPAISSDDVQLAQDLLSGNPGAFERFVDVYHSKLFQYSYLMCGQPEDAEGSLAGNSFERFREAGAAPATGTVESLGISNR